MLRGLCGRLGRGAFQGHFKAGAPSTPEGMHCNEQLDGTKSRGRGIKEGEALCLEEGVQWEGGMSQSGRETLNVLGNQLVPSKDWYRESLCGMLRQITSVTTPRALSFCCQPHPSQQAFWVPAMFGSLRLHPQIS